MYKTLPNEDNEQKKARLQKEAREILIKIVGKDNEDLYETIIGKEIPEEFKEEEIEIPEEIEVKDSIKRVYKKAVEKSNKKWRR